LAWLHSKLLYYSSLTIKRRTPLLKNKYTYNYQYAMQSLYILGEPIMELTKSYNLGGDSVIVKGYINKLDNY